MEKNQGKAILAGASVLAGLGVLLLLATKGRAKAANPVLHLPLKEWPDDYFTSELGNICTVKGARYTPDGRDFDGSTDWIMVENSELLDNIFDGGGSLACWVYLRSAGALRIKLGVGQLINNTDGNCGMGFLFSVSSQKPEEAVYLRFEQCFTQLDGDWYTYKKAVRLNQWNYLGVSYNSTSTENMPLLCVNGVDANAFTVTKPIGERNSDAGRNWYIGNDILGGKGTDGVMSEIWAFRNYLSLADHKAMYLATRPR